MRLANKRARKTLLTALILWAYYTALLTVYGKPLPAAAISGVVGVAASFLSLILLVLALGEPEAEEIGIIIAAIALVLIPIFLYFASNHRLTGWDNIAASIVAGAITLAGALLIPD